MPGISVPAGFEHGYRSACRSSAPPSGSRSSCAPRTPSSWSPTSTRGIQSSPATGRPLASSVRIRPRHRAGDPRAAPDSEQDVLRCSAAYADAPPNAHVCPVCLGNAGGAAGRQSRAVEMRLLTALALGCRYSAMQPVRSQELLVSGSTKGIPDIPVRPSRSARMVHRVCGERRDTPCGITRVHLEEDTGKSTHTRSRGRTSAHRLQPLRSAANGDRQRAGSDSPEAARATSPRFARS